MNQAIRLSTYGGGVEESPNVFKMTLSEEQVTHSGLLDIQFTVNLDGSFIVDLEMNFVADNLAAYMKTHNAIIRIANDFDYYTVNLPASVDKVVNDSLIFPNEKEFNGFRRQLVSDFSIELELPTAYY